MSITCPPNPLPLAALSLASVSALVLSGCSQSTDASRDTGDSAAPAAAATGKKPAPFSAGAVKVALVRQSGAGDYFEQWGNGAKAQAKALGIDLTVYDAQADNAKQATDLSSAINSGAKAIIIDHGFPATIQPEIDKAVKKGIKVVVYDVETATKGVVSTKQDDASMAQAVLDVMAKPGAEVVWPNSAPNGRAPTSVTCHMCPRWGPVTTRCQFMAQPSVPSTIEPWLRTSPTPVSRSSYGPSSSSHSQGAVSGNGLPRSRSAPSSPPVVGQFGRPHEPVHRRSLERSVGHLGHERPVRLGQHHPVLRLEGVHSRPAESRLPAVVHGERLAQGRQLGGVGMIDVHALMKAPGSDNPARRMDDRPDLRPDGRATGPTEGRPACRRGGSMSGAAPSSVRPRSGRGRTFSVPAPVGGRGRHRDPVTSCRADPAPSCGPRPSPARGSSASSGGAARRPPSRPTRVSRA